MLYLPYKFGKGNEKKTIRDEKRGRGKGERKKVR